jgi:hypothetical protein
VADPQGGAVAYVIRPARRALGSALRSVLGNVAEALHVTNQRVDRVEELLADIERQLAAVAEQVEEMGEELWRINHIAVDANVRMTPVEHAMTRIEHRLVETGPLVAKLWDDTAVVRRLIAIEDLLNHRSAEFRSTFGTPGARSDGSTDTPTPR